MKKKQIKKIEKELNRLYLLYKNEKILSGLKGLTNDIESKIAGIRFILHVLGYQVLFLNDKFKVCKKGSINNG